MRALCLFCGNIFIVYFSLLLNQTLIQNKKFTKHFTDFKFNKKNKNKQILTCFLVEAEDAEIWVWFLILVIIWGPGPGSSL